MMKPEPESKSDDSALSSEGIPQEISCTHCGLPVPKGSLDPSNSDQFCCNGCRSVHAILQDAGLADYYRIKTSLGERGSPAQPGNSRFPEFDSEEFASLYVRDTDRGTQCTDLYLEGVHCAACVWLVEKLPAAVPGCVSAHLDFTRSKATLEWSGERTSLSKIARFLSSLGYRPHPWRGAKQAQLQRNEDRSLWIRIGVAAFVALNIMFLAIPLYAGEYYGIEGDLEQTFRWASLLLFIPSIAWCAQTFFSGAIASLRAGVLHMDLPLSIGLSIGSLTSVWNTIRGEGDIYFDSLATLILLLLLARWLQRRGHRAARDAAELLHALTPSTARVVLEHGIEETPVETLAVGQQVEVLSGDSIPADGRVISGESFVDHSILNGESRPQPVRPGDRVFAGTVNLGSPLRITLESTGEETRVGRLMRLMEEAASRRAPIVQLADKWTGYFVAGVLSLAALTAIVWTLLDPARALPNTIAMLIVTCPCALGMATPVALAVAIGRAARRGILIKGPDTVERLTLASTIMLDKTGTITEGKLALLRWVGDKTARALLLSGERSSAHPLARAVLNALEEEEAQPLEDLREVLGGGLQARWKGQPVAIGSPTFVLGLIGAAEAREQNASPSSTKNEASGSERGLLAHEELETTSQGQNLLSPNEIEMALQGCIADGLTPVLIAAEGRLRGVAGFGDPLRADSASAIDRLRALKLDVGILSGDHPEIVSRVGEQLSLSPDNVHGGLTPEAKLEWIENASGGTRNESTARATGVVMVGDGVNDAAALGAATVGISVHGGAEASLAAADIFLARPGLGPVVEALEGARASLRVVKRNLIFSLAYNVVGASLAMAGVMSPLVAALLMPFSSLTVVASSLLSGGFKPVEDEGSKTIEGNDLKSVKG